MANMKKSKTKKRSARSIEQEEQRIAEETKIRQAQERKAANRRELAEFSKKTMISLYGLIVSIICWLVDYMGIVATVALILNIVGLKFSDKEKYPKYFWIGVAGLVLAIARIALWVYVFARYFAAA